MLKYSFNLMESSISGRGQLPLVDKGAEGLNNTLKKYLSAKKQKSAVARIPTNIPPITSNGK